MKEFITPRFTSIIRRLKHSETGSTTLVFEAITLALIVVVGVATIATIVTTASSKMDSTTTWLNCGNALDAADANGDCSQTSD